MAEKLTSRERRKRLTASLHLALEAVDRCRELLINADAEADDLAEYDAAAEGLRLTLAEWFSEAHTRSALQENPHGE